MTGLTNEQVQERIAEGKVNVQAISAAAPGQLLRISVEN